LPQPAVAEPAPNHGAFGFRPRPGLEEALRHIGELLGKLLDRAVHHGGRLAVVADQHVIERALADLVGRQIAEGILAALAQGFSPAVEDLAERALAGAVAKKALLVLQLDVVAVDLDRWQAARAVVSDARGRCDVVSHGSPVPPGFAG